MKYIHLFIFFIFTIIQPQLFCGNPFSKNQNRIVPYNLDPAIIPITNNTPCIVELIFTSNAQRRPFAMNLNPYTTGYLNLSNILGIQGNVRINFLGNSINGIVTSDLNQIPNLQELVLNYAFGMFEVTKRIRPNTQ